MKSSNFKLARFNQGLGLLQKLFQTDRAIAAQNKYLRQQKRNARRSAWGGSGQGARECARRLEHARRNGHWDDGVTPYVERS
jgi:hypothetical protein